MTEQDYFSGDTHFGVSGPDYVNEFQLVPSELLLRATQRDMTPLPYTEPAPVIITCYEIHQITGGTGIVLVFYDVATLPVDGATIAGSAGLRFMAKITAPGDFIFNPSGPGHRYNTAFGVIVSTSESVITRANQNTLVAVNYMSYRAG